MVSCSGGTHRGDRRARGGVRRACSGAFRDFDGFIEEIWLRSHGPFGHGGPALTDWRRRLIGTFILRTGNACRDAVGYTVRCRRDLVRYFVERGKEPWQLR